MVESVRSSEEEPITSPGQLLHPATLPPCHPATLPPTYLTPHAALSDRLPSVGILLCKEQTVPGTLR